MNAANGIYVTGTDTGIGKTTVSCALLQALRAQGLRAVGMKPVASGCERTVDGWRNDDALRLIAASDPQCDYALVNPYALPDPTAPGIAAAMASVVIERERLHTAFDALRVQADIVVVEGVGGWASPLSDRLDQCELAREFGLPVLLVVGLRLGCINHARLSARAIRADGLHLLGWIGNAVDSEFRHADETLAILDHAIDAPRLGLLPNSAGATLHSALGGAATHLADFRQGVTAGI
ncbi:MAG TPA: dethiobiotin synthase [Xanthomonadaceae bacterium]|nr:dethiobiotin synthase [Xanthomonadaceae bacterium]